MSWLSSSWQRRTCVLLDNAASAGTTQDATITIPSDYAWFWGSVLSTGADIRVTAADGVTVLSHKLATWTYASKAATIELDGVSVKANGLTAVWVYWGNSAATSIAASFTASSPIVGRMYLGAPVGRVVTVQPERAGAVVPRAVFSKLPSEVDYIWFDFRSVLVVRRQPYEGSIDLEAIQHVALAESQSGGSVVSGMSSYADTRLVPGVVAVPIKAGTTGDDVTTVCRVETTLGRTLEARALVRVRTVQE